MEFTIASSYSPLYELGVCEETFHDALQDIGFYPSGCGGTGIRAGTTAFAPGTCTDGAVRLKRFT